MLNNELSFFELKNIDENLRYKTLQNVKNVCNYCYKCDLSKTRTNVVFGEGIFSSKIMLIGEAPGKQEDETGKPFVGRAGKLLDKLLDSQNLSREKNIYICNLVKCRPPENRIPLNKEIMACREYLDIQIQLIKPKIIVLVGTTSVKEILKTKIGITKLRGQWFEGPFDAKIMPLLHPSYLLRNQSDEINSPKWLTLQDIKEIRKALDFIK